MSSATSTQENEESYTLEEGDRLRHLCAHFAGELGEVYKVDEIFVHPEYGDRAVLLVCVSDRRYKDRCFLAYKIERNINQCSERFGRGDAQRFEPLTDE